MVTTASLGIMATVEIEKVRITMPSILRAIAKALSTAAGPAGFPAEFALSLYDDEQAEKRIAQLMAIIEEGQTITREAIEEIFELRKDFAEMRTEWISGVTAILNLLIEDRKRLDTVQEMIIGKPSSEEMARVIIPVINECQDWHNETGILTESALIAELTRLYPDLELFLSVVYPSGFPQGVITLRMPPKVAYMNFVHNMRGLKRRQLTTIFAALKKDKPASKVIGKAALLSEEIEPV